MNTNNNKINKCIEYIDSDYISIANKNLTTIKLKNPILITRSYDSEQQLKYKENLIWLYGFPSVLCLLVFCTKKISKGFIKKFLDIK